MSPKSNALTAKQARLEAARGPALRLADRISADPRARRPKLTKTQKRNARLLARTPLPTARDREIEEGTASVVNPLVPTELMRATVNRRVDVLAEEFAHRRISKAALAVGRSLQAVFERQTATGSAGWSTGGGGGDPNEAREARICRRLEDAKLVQAEMNRLRGEVGEIGARFLRETLTGTTFKEYAERRGQGGSERAVGQVAQRFRDLLGDIVEERAARRA